MTAFNIIASGLAMRFAIFMRLSNLEDGASESTDVGCRWVLLMMQREIPDSMMATTHASRGLAGCSIEIHASPTCPQPAGLNIFDICTGKLVVPEQDVCHL